MQGDTQETNTIADKMIRCENREHRGAFGARVRAVESNHNEMEETMKTMETKIRSMDTHIQSVEREAAAAGGDARAAMTMASKARDKIQEVGDWADELQRRVRGLEISPKHEQASSHINGDIPREQRSTLVTVGFPRGQKKQDVLDTLRILLHERGFDVKEV